jgi:hypothetical protein
LTIELSFSRATILTGCLPSQANLKNYSPPNYEYLIDTIHIRI